MLVIYKIAHTHTHIHRQVKSTCIIAQSTIAIGLKFIGLYVCNRPQNSDCENSKELIIHVQ